MDRDYSSNPLVRFCEFTSNAHAGESPVPLECRAGKYEAHSLIGDVAYVGKILGNRNGCSNKTAPPTLRYSVHWSRYVVYMLVDVIDGAFIHHSRMHR